MHGHYEIRRLFYLSLVGHFFSGRDTTRKNGFNEGLFLHYLGLKPPLSHLPKVVVSPAKPSMGNVFPRVFLNLRKSLSKLLLNTMGLRTSVKYHGFQNLRKIPWVSKPH